jgi:hypothetical protein
MDKVNQILGQLGSDLLLGSVGQMKADMSFEHLTHEAVDAAADGSQQHELAATILIGSERALDGIELAAYFAKALEELEFLAIHGRHFGVLPLDNTNPGYSIYPVGV